MAFNLKRKIAIIYVKYSFISYNYYPYDYLTFTVALNLKKKNNNFLTLTIGRKRQTAKIN